jgi:hypothetical protein
VGKLIQNREVEIVFGPGNKFFEICLADATNGIKIFITTALDLESYPRRRTLLGTSSHKTDLRWSNRILLPELAEYHGLLEGTVLLVKYPLNCCGFMTCISVSTN